MNEWMPGNADGPNNFTSSIARVGATAAREYVEHPYWFVLALVLTAALALPQVMNSSNDATPPTARPGKPHAQPQAVTRSIAPPEPSSTRSTEPPNPSLTTATELPIQSVKFPNPFDSNEIFEFDPGTSKEDARAAVVEILKERALRRQ